MELDFEKFFKISTTALKIIGWDPRLKRDKLWLLQIIFMYGYTASYFSLLLYNIIYHDLKNNNFAQTAKNGAHCIIFMTLTVNTYVMIFHHNTLTKLIENIKKDYDLSKSLTNDEQSIVKKYANQGNFVCKQWLFIGFWGTSAYILKNIVLHVYYYWINEYKLVPVYDVFYPKNIEDKKDTFLVYLMTYVYLTLNSSYMSVMFTGFVPLGLIMMLHACGQLEIAKRKIDNLFVELDNDVIQEKLKLIIKHLQYIYSFVDMTGDTFRIAYEGTLMASTLLVPVSFYAVLEGKRQGHAELSKSCHNGIETAKRGEFSVEFIMFVFGGLVFSSAPCYYSDLLMEKGEEVRMSLYTCGWERHYVRSARKSLMIILMYALRPVAIKSVFRTLCLDTLADVFRRSYTIFNLMNAVWE